MSVIRHTSLLLTIATVTLASCDNRADAARQALSRADQAVAQAVSDVAQSFPERLNSVETRLAIEHRAYSQGRYADVLAAAPSISNDARELISEAAARRDELIGTLTARWGELAATVPKLIERAGAELDAARNRRPVPGADVLQVAQAALVQARAAWQQAQMAVAAGHIQEGLSSAELVQQQIAAVSSTLHAQ